jgi:hypothetical protein
MIDFGFDRLKADEDRSGQSTASGWNIAFPHTLYSETAMQPIRDRGIRSRQRPIREPDIRFIERAVMGRSSAQISEKRETGNKSGKNLHLLIDSWQKSATRK